MQHEEEILAALDRLIASTEEVLTRVQEGALAAMQACLDRREAEVRSLAALANGLDTTTLRQQERFVLTWARLMQLGQEVTIAMSARNASARVAFQQLSQKRTTNSAYQRVTGHRPRSLLSVER